jgi:hypothetical protein
MVFEVPSAMKSKEKCSQVEGSSVARAVALSEKIIVLEVPSVMVVRTVVEPPLAL